MLIRTVLLPVTVLLCSAFVTNAYEDVVLEDDDFAEFEQFDAEDDSPDAMSELFIFIGENYSLWTSK